jgi:hypothetical protein
MKKQMKALIAAGLGAAILAGLAPPTEAKTYRHYRHDGHYWSYRTHGRVTPETPNGEYSYRQSPYSAQLPGYPQWAQNALGRDRSRR